MTNQNHQDHYDKPFVTASDLAALMKAREIVLWTAGLDGDKDLTKCAETLTLVIDDIREGLEGEPE